MSTTDEARRLADALDDWASDDYEIQLGEVPAMQVDCADAAAMLRAQAAEIERLQYEGAAARDRLLHDLDRVTAERDSLRAAPAAKDPT